MQRTKDVLVPHSFPLEFNSVLVLLKYYLQVHLYHIFASIFPVAASISQPSSAFTILTDIEPPCVLVPKLCRYGQVLRTFLLDILSLVPSCAVEGPQMVAPCPSIQVACHCSPRLFLICTKGPYKFVVSYRIPSQWFLYVIDVTEKPYQFSSAKLTRNDIKVKYCPMLVPCM